MRVDNNTIRFERVVMTRIVSTKTALDRLALSDEKALLLRVAPDEGYIYPETAVQLDDYWAIVRQESGMMSAWLEADVCADILEHHCEWEPPTERPALAQGMVAGIPVKLWFEADRTLMLVPASLATEMEARL